MIAVGFFAVSGTLGVTHREIGDADRGDVGEIVDSVVQEGNAAAQDAAEDLCDYQTESGGHSPAKNGRSERRVGMACVVMTVVMRMARVIMAVRMRAHPHHSTHSTDTLQPSSALIRQFDTPPPGMN
jgi:hypothetical protein